MAMIPEGKPRDTLLKYDDPIESLIPLDKAEPKLNIKGLPSTSPLSHLLAAMKKKTQLPPLESKPSSDDILNAILPPREWLENSN